jgi:hypothetical protein
MGDVSCHPDVAEVVGEIYIAGGIDGSRHGFSSPGDAETIANQAQDRLTTLVYRGGTKGSTLLE